MHEPSATMSSCINSSDNCGIESCAHPGMSDDPALVVQAPYVKRRCAGSELVTAENRAFELELEGVNGYVYNIKYQDSVVTLSATVGRCVDPCVETWTVSLAHRDWDLFWSEACSELDQPGFPESIYVSQWASKTGVEMFRVEADRFNRRGEDFIFLSVCKDRESVIATRGRYAWGQQPYPLTLQERDEWFKLVFFIQWCDWRSLQKLFCEADKGIRRDRILSSYQSVRKRLLFADTPANAQGSQLPSLYRPKIIRHNDY